MGYAYEQMLVRSVEEATARAEAAEAECLEQARLLGMSGERELALRAELERLTATIAAQKAEIERLTRALRSIAWPMNEAGPWAQAVAASALPDTKADSDGDDGA